MQRRIHTPKHIHMHRAKLELDRDISMDILKQRELKQPRNHADR